MSQYYINILLLSSLLIVSSLIDWDYTESPLSVHSWICLPTESYVYNLYFILDLFLLIFSTL